MRHGLIRDVEEMMNDAIEMVGGTFPPEEMDDERRRRERIKREVISELRLRKQDRKKLVEDVIKFLRRGCEDEDGS